MNSPGVRQTLVHREPLADVYVREDGSVAVHDFSSRVNRWLIVLLAAPVLAVLAYLPLEARYDWEIALAAVALSTIGPLLARRLPRRVRGAKRSERIFDRP